MQLLSQGDDYDAGAQFAAVAGGGAGGRGTCLDILRKIGDLSNTSRDQSAHTSTCLLLDVGYERPFQKLFSLISRVNCACRQMEQFDAFLEWNPKASGEMMHQISPSDPHSSIVVAAFSDRPLPTSEIADTNLARGRKRKRRRV